MTRPADEGRIEGLCATADLWIEGAWRIMAEATTPSRGDLAVQLRKAERKIACADEALSNAAFIANQHSDDIREETHQLLRSTRGQFRAVSDCLERHQGHDVQPIPCVCDGPEVKEYCEADHSRIPTHRCTQCQALCVPSWHQGHPYHLVPNEEPRSGMRRCGVAVRVPVTPTAPSDGGTQGVRKDSDEQQKG